MNEASTRRYRSPEEAEFYDSGSPFPYSSEGPRVVLTQISQLLTLGGLLGNTPGDHLT